MTRYHMSCWHSLCAFISDRHQPWHMSNVLAWFIQRISSIVVETVLIFISRSNRFPETNQYWSKWGSTSRLTHSHMGHAAAAIVIACH